MSLVVTNHHYLVRNQKLHLNFDSITQTVITLQMVVGIYFKM